MNRELSAFINSSMDGLAEKILNAQYSRQESISRRYSARDRELCLKDVKYHLSYLAESIEVDSISLFIDYVKWVGALLANLKLPPEDLMINMQCMKEVLTAETGKTFESLLLRYMDSAIAGLRIRSAETSGCLNKDSPYYGLASDYINSLISGDRETAMRLIMDALDKGVSVKDLYLNVFQNTQREIGRLWHENKISVACEHFCTAATQMIMSQLYPRIFTGARDAKRKNFVVVAACAPNELHELGVRMIADFLEMEGYNTYYIGANVPPKSVIAALIERKADILALSATMTFHIKYVAWLVEEIKSSEKCSKVKVIVGGYPFNVDGNLWKTIKADGYASDMSGVAAEVGRLLS